MRVPYCVLGVAFLAVLVSSCASDSERRSADAEKTKPPSMFAGLEFSDYAFKIPAEVLGALAMGAAEGLAGSSTQLSVH